MTVHKSRAKSNTTRTTPVGHLHPPAARGPGTAPSAHQASQWRRLFAWVWAFCAGADSKGGAPRPPRFRAVRGMRFSLTALFRAHAARLHCLLAAGPGLAGTGGAAGSKYHQHAPRRKSHVMWPLMPHGCACHFCALG